MRKLLAVTLGVHGLHRWARSRVPVSEPPCTSHWCLMWLVCQPLSPSSQGTWVWKAGPGAGSPGDVRMVLWGLDARCPVQAVRSRPHWGRSLPFSSLLLL